MRKGKIPARPASSSATPRVRRLSVQSLEQRSLMAADIGMAGGFIQINGAEHNDAVQVYQQDSQLIVQCSEFDADGILLSEQQQSFAIGDVNGIFFNGKQGDDVFVNDTGVSSLAVGGEGNDILMGGTAKDVLVGNNGDDLLLGGDGNDLLLGGAGNNVFFDASGADVAPVTDVPAGDAQGGDTQPTDESSVNQPVGDAPDDSESTEGDVSTPEGSCNAYPVNTGEPSDQAVPIVADSDPVATDGEDQPASDVADEEPVAEGDSAVVDPVEDSSVTATTPVTEPTACTVTAPAETTESSEISENIVAGDEPVADTVPATEETVPSDIVAVDEPVAGDTPVSVTSTTETMVCDVPATDTPVGDVPVAEGETVDSGDIAQGVEDANTETPVIVTATGDTDSTPVATTTEEETSTPVDEVTPALEAESGNDVLVGGAGDDLIFGGDGDDLIFGDAMPEDLLASLNLKQSPWFQASAV